jgi:hypothetical protein
VGQQPGGVAGATPDVAAGAAPSAAGRHLRQSLLRAAVTLPAHGPRVRAPHPALHRRPSRQPVRKVDVWQRTGGADGGGECAGQCPVGAGGEPPRPPLSP